MVKEIPRTMTLCSMYQFQPLKNQVQSVMKLPVIFSCLALLSAICSYKNDTVHVKISAKPSMLGIVTRQSVFCGKGVKFPVSITQEVKFPVEFQEDINFRSLICNVSFRKTFFATINRIVQYQTT